MGPSEVETGLQVLKGGFLESLATLTFFALIWLSVPIDILITPHRHDQRIASVDILWAIASVAFFPVGPIAWFVFGRSIRRRELRAAAEREGALAR